MPGHRRLWVSIPVLSTELASEPELPVSRGLLRSPHHKSSIASLSSASAEGQHVIFSYTGELVAIVMVIIINNHTDELDSSLLCRVYAFNRETWSGGKKLPARADCH